MRKIDHSRAQEKLGRQPPTTRPAAWAAKPAIPCWPYWGTCRELFTDPRFSDRDLSLITIKRRHIKLLQDLIAQYRPRLGPCCGKSTRSAILSPFPGTDVQQAALDHPCEPGQKVITADRLKYGRRPSGGRVVMISHPVARGANARWRIEALVQCVQGKRLI